MLPSLQQAPEVAGGEGQMAPMSGSEPGGLSVTDETMTDDVAETASADQISV